jgi:hypothetical protein
MRNQVFILSVILFTCSLNVTAQKVAEGTKIKTITEYNINNKKKELDHVTNFNQEGLKTEEIEYFSDGLVKTKTVYDHDSQKRCIKATRYGIKGKIDKITTYEYDNSGNRIRESTSVPEKRYRTEKSYEYSYY